jgi:DNA-binding NarL/FixJ family response regulator
MLELYTSYMSLLMRTSLNAGAAGSLAVKRRVLIVDDNEFFAACLSRLLNNESDLTVCDVTTTPVQLDSRIKRLHPDIIVLDVSLGADNGLDLGRRLREMQIATPILFISTLYQPTRAQLAAVSHSAFVPKSGRPSDVLTALRSILAGPNVSSRRQQIR